MPAASTASSAPPPTWSAPVAVFDPNDPRFLPPGDIPSRVEALCQEQGLAVPSGRPEMVRSILESLARAFADAVQTAAALSGKVGDDRAPRRWWCAQRTAVPADRRIAPGCRLSPVRSRPPRSGNVLVQARACGMLSGGVDALRAVVADSVSPRTYRADVEETSMTRRIPKPRDFADLLRFQRPTAERHRTTVGAGADDRRPARHRPTGDAQGAVRLHRRCRRGRALAGQGAAGVRGRRVPSRDPARRVQGRHVVRGDRRAERAAVRHRPDRIHSNDAQRGGAGGSGRRRRGRDPVLAVDRRHHDSGGRRRRQPDGTQLVPALHVEGPRSVDGSPGVVRRRPGSTPCSSRSTCPSPAPGFAIDTTASRSRRH